MVDLRFEDPPERVLLRRTSAGGRYAEFAIALREHLNRWAVLPSEDYIKSDKTAQQTAQSIRTGRQKGFGKGEYEAVNEGTKVWVRFTGAKDDAEDPDGVDVPAPLARTVRAWAKAQGIEMPERGRLPRDVLDRYTRETGGPTPRPRSVRRGSGIGGDGDVG